MHLPHSLPKWSFLSLALAGSLSLLGSAHATSYSLTTNDGAGETSFQSPMNPVGGHWSSGAAPSFGNDYVVNGFLLRTVQSDTDPQAFAGTSLTLAGVDAVRTTSGQLGFKTGGVVTVANLILNYGWLINAGFGALSVNGVATLDGAITLGAGGGSLETFDTSGRGFLINSTIGGSGSLTLHTGNAALSTNVITLNPTGTSNYTGGTTWATASAEDSVVLGNANALGHASGTLTLNNTAGVLNLNNNSSIGIGRLVGVAGSVISGGTTSGATLLTVGNTGTGNDGTASTFAGILGNGSGGRTLALTKTGAGTQTLSGVNTYTGVTTLTGGILSVGTIGNGGVAGNLGQATNATTNLVFNGGTLQYTGAIASSDRTFTINAGTTATLEITTNNLSIAGATGAATNGALTKTGAGTLTLTSANTYTGLTTVSAGTLAYGTSNVISSGAVTVNGATAVLALGANSDSVGAVTVSGGGSITGSGTLTSTGSFEMQSGSVSAVLGGSGIALNKTTVGTVTLSGANTYTGTTLVSGGTLILSGSGSIANSAVVDVQSGAILSTSGVTFGTGQTVKGNGTIIGDTVLQGTLAAGNSPGILTFNDDLTLTSSADSIFEIQNTGMVRGTDYDGVNVVSSVLTYDGKLTLSMTSLVSAGTYNLFDFGSITGNFDTVAFSGLAYTGTFTYDGSNFYTATSNGQVFSFGLASGDLIVSAIPEPSTTLLLAGALTALVVFRRRTRN